MASISRTRLPAAAPPVGPPIANAEARRGPPVVPSRLRGQASVPVYGQQLRSSNADAVQQGGTGGAGGQQSTNLSNLHATAMKSLKIYFLKKQYGPYTGQTIMDMDTARAAAEKRCKDFYGKLNEVTGKYYQRLKPVDPPQYWLYNAAFNIQPLQICELSPSTIEEALTHVPTPHLGVTRSRSTGPRTNVMNMEAGAFHLAFELATKYLSDDDLLNILLKGRIYKADALPGIAAAALAASTPRPLAALPEAYAIAAAKELALETLDVDLHRVAIPLRSRAISLLGSSCSRVEAVEAAAQTARRLNALFGELKLTGAGADEGADLNEEYGNKLSSFKVQVLRV